MRTIQVRLNKKLIKKAKELVERDLYASKSEVIRDALRRLYFPQISTKDREFRVIYTSDIHGNLAQYKKLFGRAIETKADSIIIGGDLLPKDKKNRTPIKQRRFLEKELIPLICKFHKKNAQKNHKCKIFILLGNDDFRKNLSVLKRNQKKGGYKAIQNKCISFYENFKIAGYSYVPLTPFSFKDWERLDLNDEKETKTRENFILEGKINNSSIKKFDLSDRKYNIEKDLQKLTKNKNPKELILVTHAPPYNTSLDMISQKKHVGSKAIKKIIKEKQPLVGLHGHIHETVKLSGHFFEEIGNTLSISSGNDHINKKLSIIEFNLFNPRQTIKRICI
ncbi:hypothetical protein GF378_03365 [Candidatus Pacearchaeota archaeon]|nr:hypothetical protein [Candidatus Pacearchaeota archaeon]